LINEPRRTPAPSEVGLLEGIATTRAIRRFRPDPIPPEDLAKILFAATRAPSGSNLQPFRFLVLRDGPVAREARQMLGECFRSQWSVQKSNYGYGKAAAGSRAARMGETMQHFVDHFEETPVIILVCGDSARGATENDGGQVFPAMQNLLLAARALGYGGTVSMWHHNIEEQLRQVLSIPATAYMFATIPLGRPVGGHGAVRRLPIRDVVYDDSWGATPEWAIDPPGTRYSGISPNAAKGSTAGGSSTAPQH
jgi:nitroreductase